MVASLALRPIHPFPARMAPEIALAQASFLPSRSIVLDPMVGSGTVVRAASQHGHKCFGFDMDPLAVLMTKVWTTPIDSVKLSDLAHRIVTQANTIPQNAAVLPWIDDDPETSDFINYWFGKEQQADLRRLSFLLKNIYGPLGDSLRIALSRIIITKKRGASLAWDVSHSRPHRVHDNTDFSVLSEFLKSVTYLVKRMNEQPPPGNVKTKVGDARNLKGLPAGSIDAVITSPPYLNAIDYLRGHKLALVWLGYRCSELRIVRSISVGSARSPNPDADIALAKEITSTMQPVSHLPKQERHILNRYALDLYSMIKEFHRVIRPKGKAVLVVGNSCLRGVYVETSLAVSTVASKVGFQLVDQHERNLPPTRRYLPPPADIDNSDLKKRMRTESVLTFVR